MKFLDITIHNFLSFADGPHSVDLRKRGLVLLEGENRDDASTRSNGAGKTGVVDALLWCLFGLTTRGYENDDVVNNKTNKNCLVSVNVKLGKRAIVITRTRKHTTHKNSLFVSVDGTLVTKPSVKETQEYIEKLLETTAQTFLNSVVFGQTLGYRFSQLTDKQQKDVLDEALGIPQYAAACDLARTHLKEVKAKREAIDACLHNAQVALKSQEALVKQYRLKHKDFRRDIQQQSDELTRQIIHIRDRRSEIKARLAAYGDVANAQKTATEARRSARKALDAAQARAATAKAHVATTKQAAEKLAVQVEHKEGTLEEVRALSDGVRYCDECGQEVSHTIATAALAAAEQAYEEATAHWKEAVSKDALARAAVKSAQEKADEADELYDKANALVTRVAALDVESTMLATERDKLKSALDALDAKVSPYKEMVETAEAAASKHKQTIKECTLQRMTEIKQEALLTYWVEAFGAKGLKSYLLDTALPFLNERVADYAKVLTDGNIHIQFKTVSTLKSGKEVDRFEVDVTNVHGAHSYVGASAGEKAKIDLCVGLALQALVTSRGASSTNVAFFDEPFEHIDDEGVERVIELLTNAAKNRESIFVITHNEALKSYFSNTIKVVKVGGASHFE